MNATLAGGWAEYAAREFEAAATAQQWLYDPVGWAGRHIELPPGASITAYQADILNLLAVERRVAMRGPHGAGKSFIASIAVNWFAQTRDTAGYDWKIITTASAWRHLSTFLWPEVRRWARAIRWDTLGRGPYDESSELLALNLKLANGAASAVASNRPELIEGAHADSLLYILDEAKAIPAGTWDAVEGALSGGRKHGLPEAFVLALSTPGPPTGRFYDIHSRKPGYEDWTTRHVTLAEAVTAGRIAPEWVEQRKRQWGEDSAIYQNRVLGQFAASESDAVIPLSWVEAAIERWHEWDTTGRPPPADSVHVIGVDVARGGGDESVLAYRHGPIITTLDTNRARDTMAVTALVQAAAPHGSNIIPVVDSLGVGGGVVDRLSELGFPVIPYTGSAKTNRRTQDRSYGFNVTRSAAYWNLRELLDPANEHGVCLPPDDLLISDLTTPTWDTTTGSPPKIRVEPKDDLVKRLGRSPDRGDAVAMAFFYEHLGGGPVVAHVPTRQTARPASRWSRRVTH